MNVLAKQVLSLIDLTSLNEQETDAQIENFCTQAITPYGNVASVCIYPRFVRLVREKLNTINGEDIAVATVVNFPEGNQSLDAVLNETQQALADGASEIDLVLPYTAIQSGDTQTALTMVKQVKDVLGNQACLKVIIESGAFPDQTGVRIATEIAIAGQADFVKTSTGKTAVGATPEAVKTICEVIAQRSVQSRVGVKVAGGVRTLDTAIMFLTIISDILGAHWVTPTHVRFGASALIDDVIDALKVGDK